MVTFCFQLIWLLHSCSLRHNFKKMIFKDLLVLLSQPSTDIQKQYTSVQCFSWLGFYMITWGGGSKSLSNKSNYPSLLKNFIFLKIKCALWFSSYRPLKVYILHFCTGIEKLSSSNFLENCVKLFNYLRKRLVCTLPRCWYGINDLYGELTFCFVTQDRKSEVVQTIPFLIRLN